jgi:BlaI family transcriptional regulator, penicillinase repressor
MARKTSPTLTQVELEFMQILWNGDDMTTEDIQAKLADQDRDLSDGSIRKILSILLKKNQVERDKVGRGFVYRALVQQDQARHQMLGDLLGRAFQGSAQDLVATLLNSEKVSEAELKKIRNLLDEHERGEDKS